MPALCVSVLVSVLRTVQQGGNRLMADALARGLIAFPALERELAFSLDRFLAVEVFMDRLAHKVMRRSIPASAERSQALVGLLVELYTHCGRLFHGFHRVRLQLL